MLKRILDRYTNPITIQIHPDLFHFSSGSEDLQLRTFINIHFSNGKWLVHSVGEDVLGSPNVHRIDLFLNSTLPSGGDRSEAFEAFLRYAVQKLHNKSRIFLPLVIVKGAESLDKTLVGYQYNFLKKILGEAGAREVRFE